MKIPRQDRALSIVDYLRNAAALRRCTARTQDRRDYGRGPRIETLQEHIPLFGKKVDAVEPCDSEPRRAVLSLRRFLIPRGFVPGALLTFCDPRRVSARLHRNGYDHHRRWSGYARRRPQCGYDRHQRRSARRILEPSSGQRARSSLPDWPSRQRNRRGNRLQRVRSNAIGNLNFHPGQSWRPDRDRRPSAGCRRDRRNDKWNQRWNQHRPSAL